MMRVLHLFGRAPDFSTAHAAEMLQAHSPPDITVNCRQIGSGGADLNPLISCLKLRHNGFDLVHAWDPRALLIGALATSSPVLFTPADFSIRKELNWLPILTKFRNARVVCSTGAQRELLLREGISARRCRQIEPGLERNSVSFEPNTKLREKLGLASDDFVLLAPGESNRLAGHRLALWAVSILHVYDPRYRLLIWGRGEQTHSLQTLARKLRQPKVLICAEQALKRPVDFHLFPTAADMILATGHPAAAPFSLALCMASGKPIVGSADGLAGSFLSDGESAAMVPCGTARPLAQRVHEISRDVTLQRKLAAGARKAATMHFALPQFLNGYFDLYRALTPVSCTPDPSLRSG